VLAVAFVPVPTTTGTLPATVLMANSTILGLSSAVTVGLSPVVPRTTRKSTPPSICQFRNLPKLS
jgi:hypothetical protein